MDTVSAISELVWMFVSLPHTQSKLQVRQWDGKEVLEERHRKRKGRGTRVSVKQGEPMANSLICFNK